MSSHNTLDRMVASIKRVKSAEPDVNKPVFWLGAGCSVFDGIPLNATLLNLVMPADWHPWGSPQFRFDKYCDLFDTGTELARLFAPHLLVPIKDNSPYHGLVKLLIEGYADVVVTFNIDDLLEQALRAANLTADHDYRIIKVPSLRDAAAVSLIEERQGPRIKIIKLHGDAREGFSYMTSKSIASYPDVIKQAVADLSQRTAIVCGYSFFHLNVLNSFSSKPAPFFYVSRSFPEAPMVLSLMSSRNERTGTENFIDGSLGIFDCFVETLLGRLGL